MSKNVVSIIHRPHWVQLYNLPHVHITLAHQIVVLGRIFTVK